jgi:hypothetical protein
VLTDHSAVLSSGATKRRIELIFAPKHWAQPMEWLPVLGTYVTAVAPEGNVKLYLDGRSADVDARTLRAIIQRAGAYIAEDHSKVAPVVLLDGTEDDPSDAQSVLEPTQLIELLGLDVRSPAETPIAITQHAVWVKTLVDDIQADLDRAAYLSCGQIEMSGSPLVTVRIATYGPTERLLDRAIASVLAGPYQNVELLVCSDGPQPHARAAVGSVADSRVRYMELEQRPAYPSHSESFWQTAGAFAVNRLLEEARGVLIAPLDHDDAFTFNHIPVLLAALAESQSDFVYGQAMTEWPLGDWRLHGSAPLAYGQINHAAVMYSARLSHLRYDPLAWLLDEPADWNMWRRMRDAGAVISHVPQPVAVHFKERSSIDHRERHQNPGVEVTAHDIVSTSARDLLTVSSWRYGPSLASK